MFLFQTDRLPRKVVVTSSRSATRSPPRLTGRDRAPYALPGNEVCPKFNENISSRGSLDDHAHSLLLADQNQCCVSLIS
jgi:hypothetical protein